MRSGLSGFELVVLTLGGAAILVIGVVWAGAALALLVTGQPVDVTPGQAAAILSDLAGRPGDPAAAWPAPVRSRLPGPLLYWVCTAAAGVVGVALAAVGV